MDARTIILLLLSIILFHGPQTAQGATLTEHSPIFINGDSGWINSNGVLPGGNGSSSNPYIIESWNISAPNAPGIHINNTRSYFIIRNVFIHDGNTTGILLENVADGIVENSTITNNSNGIVLAGCTRNIIQSNTLLHNHYGIEVEGGKNNTLAGNQAYYSLNNTLTGNTLVNNKFGIHITNSSPHTKRKRTL